MTNSMMSILKYVSTKENIIKFITKSILKIHSKLKFQLIDGNMGTDTHLTKL